MSSFQFEPDECAGQVGHGFEIALELLKAGRNTAEVFKSSKEIFHQVAKLVEMGIELWIGFLAVGFSGNHGSHTGCPGLLTNGL